MSEWVSDKHCQWSDSGPIIIHQSYKCHDPECALSFQSDSWRGESYKTQSQNGKKEFTFSWGVIGSVMGVTEPNHLGQRTQPPIASFNIKEVPTDVFPFPCLFIFVEEQLKRSPYIPYNHMYLLLDWGLRLPKNSNINAIMYIGSFGIVSFAFA